MPVRCWTSPFLLFLIFSRLEQTTDPTKAVAFKAECRHHTHTKKSALRRVRFLINASNLYFCQSLRCRLCVPFGDVAKLLAVDDKFSTRLKTSGPDMKSFKACSSQNIVSPYPTNFSRKMFENFTPHRQL